MLSKIEEISLLQRQFLTYHRLNHQKFLEDLGLYYGQPMMLMCLADNGELSQKELARFLHTSSAAVAVSVKRLEKKGLLKKRVDKEDMRFNKIALTEEGAKKAAAAKEGMGAVDKRCFDGFSEEELDALVRFYERMIKNLESEVKE